ncbi:uncharacterized protein VTP21DRAFT_26 [Calcarisporiella thermophila]|uniref:uncharacterized protein n=1 Tax=Calcarisporiella thermophila TaxID=911321 RepID=UPI0037446051
MSPLFFYLNGTPVTLENPDPDTTLLQYVRSVGLTGTKLGCAEGGCGACTVVVSSYDRVEKTIKHCSVNACLAPLCSVDGKHVITIEGIGNSKNPHPVQERIALSHGSQCGFCTPGIAMSLYALLRNNPTPTQEEVEESFDGNLCRCTGYRPILAAARTFASQGCCKTRSGIVNGNGDCSENASCCKSNTGINGSECSKPSTAKGCCRLNGSSGGCCLEDDVNGLRDISNFPKIEFRKYDSTQELIFPPALVKYNPALQSFKGRLTQWFRPVTVAELVSLKREYPTAKIVAGNTEVGVETKFKHVEYPVQIYAGDIPELRHVELGEDGLRVGANVTLARFQIALEEAIKECPREKTEGFSALLENLRWFAGHQIRNVATPAGNIATASPISDLNPVFVATGSVVTCVSSSPDSDVPVERTLSLTEFFKGYRRTALNPGEILTNVFVPYTRSGEFVRAYKQAKRKDDDIAIVNAGMRAWVVDGKVRECCLAFGGMGPTTITAKAASKMLIGKDWSEIKPLTEEICGLLSQDMPLNFSSPGGMPTYRAALAYSFFFRFWNDVAYKLGHESLVDTSMLQDLNREVSSSKTDIGDMSQNTGVLGQPIPHVAAMKQVTGEAIYIDDIPKQVGELYGALVMSEKAHAKILSVDPSEALEMEGVVAYYGADDIPGINGWGHPTPDEEIFASKEVHCVGQSIGVILAENQTIAQRAARKVKVEYEVLPHVVTIEEAIEANSFYPFNRTINRGDIDEGFAQAAHVFEGELHIGGQEHFYLETQASIVIPKGEDNEMEIHASTQNATETQMVIASALGIAAHKVVCKVRRLGGGFGGKETRSIPLTAALAIGAHHSKRPVRCMLDRDEDMLVSGQRHPFLGKWKVGVSSEGKVLALDLKLYNNGGWSCDLSHAVMERAMSHSDNCYFIPHVRVQGRVCRTNIHSNTAFRGFGGPQGMFICEAWMHEVADRLGMDLVQFKEINMYREGQYTHFNQELKDWHIPEIWRQLKASSEYERRRREVDEFNATSRWKKRGLSLIPTKFGISFTALHMNQAGALVHIYNDGSVLLSHGGTEMGQGLHTKMIQVCAAVLDIPVSAVHIMETATNTVANTSPTAASASSDLNGMAVKDACEQLKRRLAPYREKMPNATLKELAHAAYMDRVNLSAQGFYATPDIGYDWQTNSGMLYYYFTLGAACVEVEVDVATGEHVTVRADIVMDVGRSLNRAIDMGQVEGAFVQGAGWCTMEETLFFPDGRLFTRGPGNYKLPGFRDIPRDFRVSILKGVEYKHLKTIASSKGVGEPPLFLGSGVYFAIRDAVKSARKDAGVTEPVRIDSPATPERVRLACGDGFVTMAQVERREGEKPWVVQF